MPRSTSLFSKHHYNWLAETIDHYYGEHEAHTVDDLVCAIANRLREDNEKFIESRFLEACWRSFNQREH